MGNRSRIKLKKGSKDGMQTKKRKEIERERENINRKETKIK